MFERKLWWTALAGILFLISTPLWGVEVSVEGGPMEPGFNSGTFAYVHATVHGLAGKPKRYVVFAEIQYYGTTSSASVEMDRLPETTPGVEDFQVGWPIPPQAPTGFYTVVLHVDDRIDHSPEVSKKVRGFVVYKKLVRISRVALDKSVYEVGEPLKCEVGLENLSDTDIKGLRLEFSNGTYPWISLAGQRGRDNPELSIRLLRENLDIPAGNALTVPMMPAGIATLSRERQEDKAGSSAAPGNEKKPPSDVATYAIALWNADHTVLYDMQFTPPAVVRTEGGGLAKPYNRNYTHPYNSSIDFVKYREFYAPGEASPALRVDPAHTLYRPGDTVKITATLSNPGQETWTGASLEAHITDSKGAEVYTGTLVSGLDLAASASRKVSANAWSIPATQTPGTYPVQLTVAGTDGKPLAHCSTEIAVNTLPASLLVVCSHEEDEQAYAGLIRAAVEANLPVQVLILTAGDVSHCDRYFGMPCGPNEAREFGAVRMEESSEALEHLELAPEKLTVMGLPEGGLGAIWLDHKESSNLYLSISLGCDHAPYPNVYRPNLPYARDAVLEAMRQFIADSKPAMLALPNPDSPQDDQRAASWFAIRACEELVKSKVLDPQTVLLAEEPTGAGNSQPAPYKYEEFVLHLSGVAAALKQEAAWFYQSQDGNQLEAERKTLAELPRQERHLRISDWQEHAGWNENGRN
jgi:LmbE family N-acetylglucosaminyl deacetylase